MKKHILFIVGLTCFFSNAQNINDVLLYSKDNTQGTARYQAMSGAFGALGGDLSSLNVNPAGSAVFNNSQFTISASNYNVKNEAYMNVDFAPKTSTNEFNFNQIGGVIVLNSKNPNSNWKKISLGFNFDKVQDFNSEYTASYNTANGIDNYFLSFADGEQLGLLQIQNGEFIEEAYLDIGASLGFGSQQAFLGLYGGLINAIDPDDENNIAYESNATYTTVDQEYRKVTSGYNDRYTFNIGGQYRDDLYLGASININSIYYEQLNELTETGYDASSQIQFAYFDNFLITDGNAFSFDLGAIKKINNNVRLGASYKSPTWYRLEDQFSQQINSDLADNEIDFINFNIVNLYEKYTIKVPSELTGSVAVIFGTNGLLSLDYSYQDMSKAELRPESDPSFESQNELISEELGAVSTFRLGGEYRIKQFSLRGGFRYEESPYNNNTIGDLTGYSSGIGFNFGPSKLDLAINTYSQDSKESVLSTDATPTLNVDRTNTNVTLSYTVNF
ncbi:outer membrane protein transport protein [Cellulophaga baltica]|uniref:OmpP1/FadL family transporter n=1 Tax=Cellulophaga TaxID=104264 RepID=UPI001C0789BF|nr:MULTISPECIES: outer membrane protein transport protein [Cellulophaga]MBU2996959.1 outer membrane protein transport protein [Cellulophaga baltica]MDO6768357.1 outer membrane protein transport protein [Cellulophaga sp. 1_MG-2023]